jgi:signal transduction histidine kinase
MAVVVQPRWVRPAGFGLLSVLVVLAWVQSGALGLAGGWPVAGGVAVLVLWVAIDRLAPGVPAVVLTLVVPAAVVALTGGDPSNIGWFVLVVLAGLVALRLPFVAGLLGWLVSVLAIVVLAVTNPDPGWPNWVAGTALLFWGCWAARYRIGLLERVHRAEAAAAESAAAVERQRLAADLHDIVAHTLAVTVLHLGGVRLALGHEPERAEAGIVAAERLARQSMSELRRVVRVLAADNDRADRVEAPQPVATDLPALLEQYRAAGLTLSAGVSGDLLVISAPTGHVLYRLVREALANASRHAPGQPVEVGVQVSADGAVRATVSNPCPMQDRREVGGGGGGMGLSAMAGRVRMVGGQLSAGAEDGRWVVRAELPA